MKEWKLKMYCENFHNTYGPGLLSLLERRREVRASFICFDRYEWHGQGNLQLRPRKMSIRTFGDRNFMYAMAYDDKGSDPEFSLGVWQSCFSWPIHVEQLNQCGFHATFLYAGFEEVESGAVKMSGFNIPAIHKALSDVSRIGEDNFIVLEESEVYT